MEKKIKKRQSSKKTSDQSLLYGIAPVHQCLLHQSRRCDQLLVKAKSSSKRVKEILHLARKSKIPIVETDAHKLADLSRSKLHQGVVLKCGELKSYDLEDFLEKFQQSDKKLLIALDQIEDPQNVGAIIRSAAFLGAEGLITLRNHAAPLSATVSKASAGTLEHFPIIQVANLSECLQKLKREGFTALGAMMGDDSIDFKTVPVTDFMVLVLGNEGQGLRKLTQKRCDFLVHIPGKESTESLNVSAAAAILIQNLLAML